MNVALVKRVYWCKERWCRFKNSGTGKGGVFSGCFKNGANLWPSSKQILGAWPFLSSNRFFRSHPSVPSSFQPYPTTSILNYSTPTLVHSILAVLPLFLVFLPTVSATSQCVIDLV